ncbi:MAG: hypothetical protein RLZZ08_1218 [Pseudomonadota bacterium]
MTINRLCLLLPLAALTATLAACSTPARDDYPSLAVRPAERVTGTAEVVAQPLYVPPPPAAGVIDRLAQLREQADAAHARFITVAQNRRATVTGGRGAAEGTEAWALAAAATADLDSARSQTMIALADLDRIYVDAAVNGSELERIATARDAVAALVAQEDATLAGITGTR